MQVMLVSGSSAVMCSNAIELFVALDSVPGLSVMFWFLAWLRFCLREYNCFFSSYMKSQRDCRLKIREARCGEGEFSVGEILLI